MRPHGDATELGRWAYHCHLLYHPVENSQSFGYGILNQNELRAAGLSAGDVRFVVGIRAWL